MQRNQEETKERMEKSLENAQKYHEDLKNSLEKKIDSVEDKIKSVEDTTAEKIEDKSGNEYKTAENWRKFARIYLLNRKAHQLSFLRLPSKSARNNLSTVFRGWRNPEGCMNGRYSRLKICPKIGGRHSIRGARVTADGPCESLWMKEIERENPNFNVSTSEPRETQLQALGMRQNRASVNKLSSSVRRREGRRIPSLVRNRKAEIWISHDGGRQIMRSYISRVSILLQ
ncbi:hypothetical protein TNCV_243031 [Trichonephila clavipes]|uniref:Uncharacterized protein n=1 Tax=Trichonephila clavipes TaxID=2585209 RepID=A0A8X6W446_TRICX|nr:hypothetical protein TNCV_243031 [Trichonephila clavipes]